MKKSHTLRGYISGVCICAMVVTVFIIGIVSYSLIKNNSMGQIRKVDSWMVKQQSENVSYLIEKYDALALDLAFDSDLQKTLIDFNNHVEGYDINSVRIRISRIFTEKYSYSDDFSNIILFSLDGQVLGMKNPFDIYANISSYNWFDMVSGSMGENIWLEPTTDSRGESTANTLSMPMVRKIFSAQKHGNVWNRSAIALPQGYLLVYLNMEAFTELMNEEAVKEFKQFLLIDENYQVIGSTNKEDVGHTFNSETDAGGFVDFNGQSYMMTTEEISGSEGWSFVVLTEADEVTREANQALILCLMICGILAVVLFVLTRILSSRVNEPVKVLHTFFKKAEAENVAITHESVFEEFNDLYQSFNHMVNKIYTMSDEIRKREIMQRELETKSRESQIGALQMQINPHFLYNTLDCINWMAQMKGDSDVSEMILTLGKFFRSNTEMKGIYTSIEQEIKNIKLYMTLAKLRYLERLNYSIEVDKDLFDLQIIKLLLQPLVENSIKYGLDKSTKDGHIHLWIGQEDECIVVSVTDDGMGMDFKQLEMIRRLWENIANEQQDIKSVGLYNIMRRLYLCYKDECSFEIFSEKDSGTNIVITYPRVRYVPEN